MKFAPFFQDIHGLRLLNSDAISVLGEKEITGITSDSRKVTAGMVFVALIGTQTDGHQYLEKAIASGAIAVVVEEKRNAQHNIQKQLGLNSDCPKGVALFESKNTYQALGELSSAFYEHPGRHMTLVGVTGTNGKTTVTHLLERMISDSGQLVGMIGTLGQRVGQSKKEQSKKDKTNQEEQSLDYETTGHTTPMAVELHSILRDMEKNKTEAVVLEVSSHALEQHRVYGCDFDLAIHTNLTQDHLDYHKTMENYGKAKALLFSGLRSTTDALGQKPAAVINLDDAWGKRFLEACPEGTRIYTYGIDSSEATVRPEQVNYSISGASFMVNTAEGTAEVQLKIAGRFSVYNALAAIAGGLALGIPLADCVKSLEVIEGVRGRFEVVSKEPYVIVDYAHTPDGLENILSAARLVTPEKGRLIAVFGCGGDRDATKRPKMGAIVERLADLLVVTSDNPRTEDPQQILTDVISGIKKFDSECMLVNVDREQAIYQAIDLAKPNDIIVVAGKGHEDYQILAHETIHFDDREMVQNYVKSRKQETPA